VVRRALRDNHLDVAAWPTPTRLGALHKHGVSFADMLAAVLRALLATEFLASRLLTRTLGELLMRRQRGGP
jgi:hypothetical protein